MAGMKDLNKMFKRGQKMSKQVPIKAGSWIKNVAESFGYAAQEILTDIAPNSVNIIQNSAETANAVRENLMQAKSQGQKVSSALDISTYLKLGKDYGRNAIEDLMSGNFYAKEREQKVYDEAVGEDDFNDLDFDFDDDFDFDEGDDFEIEAESSSGNASATMSRKSKGRNEVTQVNVYNGFDENNPLVKSTEFQTQLQMEATGVLVDTHKASMNTFLMHTTKLQKQTTAGLLSINDKLGQIHTTIAENQTRLINVSETYYNDSMELFKQMLDRLNTIKEHTAIAAVASAARNVDDYNDQMDMFRGGMVSIKDYKAYVKKNINNAIESNLFTSQLKTMATDTDILKQAVATPLRGVVKNMVGQIVPQVLETSIKEFDQTLGEFVLTGLTKIGSYRTRYDNPILRTLGEIFGITNRYETIPDKSKYEKGAVAWDGISHRTLNDVIPNYLRQIAAAVTGTEEMAFDYERGVYRKLSSMQKEHENNLRSKALSPFFEDVNQFKEYIEKNYAYETREQRDEIQKKFEDALRAMVARGGIKTYYAKKNSDGIIVDEFADLFGDHTGSRAVELARSFFEGRYGADNGSLNMRTFGRNIQEARANVSKYTRDVEADPIRYNGQYISNGLSNVNKKTGRITTGIGGLGGKDKYDMTALDYLRKTLLTLNTGIKVYVMNNGSSSTNGEEPSSIKRESDKVIKEFKQKTKHLKALEARQDSNDVGALSQEEYERAISEGKIDINDPDLNSQSMTSIATAYHQNRITTANQSNRKPSILEKLAGMDGTFGKWFGKANDAVNNMAQKTQSLFRSANNFLYTLIFGTPDGTTRRDALLTSLITSMKMSFHKFGIFLDKKVLTPLDEKLFGEDGLFAKLKETQFGQDIKNGFNRIKESIFGEKIVNSDGTTSYRGGILSNTANELSNMGKEVKVFLLGGKDAQGNKIDPESDHSVLGEAKRMFRNMSSSITDAMGIGKNASGKQMTFRDAMSKGIDDIWKHTKERSSEWLDLIFGKHSDSDNVQTGRDVLTSFNEELRGKSGKIGAGAVIGASGAVLFGNHLGIMGSLFLPGGPIGGALLGTGISIVKNSDTLKRLLFGDVDENGKRLGGVISKQTQDFFNNNKTGIKIGAFAGLAASMGFLPAMMVPGGPIGGALVGGAVSLATKSGAFNELLYGPNGDKDNPIGGLKKKFQDIFGKDKRTKDLAKDAGMGAGVGLVGSFFLPGGPITGALLGSAASIAMNTETFKTLMFGTGEVDENGKKNGGLFGKARDFIGHKVLEPLSTTVQLAQAEFNAFVEKNMVLPLKRAMTPITDRLAKIGLNIENGFKGFFQSVSDKFHEVVLKPIGEKVSDMLAPFKSAVAKIFKGIFGFFGNMISSPFRFIEGVAQGIYEQDKKKGGNFEVNKARSVKTSEMKDALTGKETGWTDAYESFIKSGMSEEDAIRMANETVGNQSDRRLSMPERFKRASKAGLGWLMADNKETREKGEHGIHGASYYTKDNNIYTQRQEDNARIDAELAQRKADILNGKYQSVLSFFGGKKKSKSNTPKPESISVENTSGDVNSVETNTSSEENATTNVDISTPVDVNESVRNQTVILNENHDKLTAFLTDFRDKLFAYLDDVRGTTRAGVDSAKEKFNEGKEFFRNAKDARAKVYKPNTETAASSSFKSSDNSVTGPDDRTEVVGPKQKKEKVRHSTNWYLDKIYGDVSKISDSVYGQLNGVGSNVNKTYRLLLKTFGETDDNISGDNNKSHVGFFGKLRTALNDPGKFISNIGSNIFEFVTKPFKAAHDVVFTFVSGAKEAGKALLNGAISLGKGLAKGLFEIVKLPGKLLSLGIEVVKSFGPAIGEAFKQTFRVVGTALVGGIDLVVSGIKGAAGVLKGAVTGLMDLAGGIFSMAGNLFKGAGIIGLELLKGGVKVGKKVVGGIAKGVGTAAGLVTSGFKNKFFKDKTPGASKTNLMYVNVVGGHLNEVDVVHTVERVILIEKNDSFGDKASETLRSVAERVYELFRGKTSGEENPGTISGIIGDVVGFSPDNEQDQETKLQLPAIVPNGLQLPVSSSNSALVNVANKAKQTLELQNRVKNNSAEVQNARNDEEEKEKLDLDFKTKLLGFMRRDEDRTVEHNTIWNKVFGPKGLLIAGLLFIGIPLIKKIFNVVKNFVGDFARTIGDAINKIAEGLKNVGGVGGAIANALEMGGNFLSAITGSSLSKSMYATDDSGNIMVDENGDPIYQDSKKLSIAERVANAFTQNKQRVDHDTGKIYEERNWTNISGAMATGIKNVGVGALIKNFNKGNKLVKTGARLVGSNNVFIQKLGQKYIDKGAKRLAFDARIAGGLRSAGGAILGKAKTVINKSASGNGLIAKFIAGGKSALEFLSTKVIGFLKSKGLLNEGSKVTSLLKKAYTILDDKILSKFAPKISAFFTRLGTSASSGFLLDVAFGAFGVINTNPAAVFGVRVEDVDFKMQVIARLIKSILNTSIAGWLDLISQIIYEVFGFDLIQELCVLLYNIISGEKDEAKLAEARANCQSDYEEYVKEEYEAYMENVNENGGQPMSFDEYKQSPLCTSKSDYMVKQNPTLSQRVINTAKTVGGAVMHPIKTTKNLMSKGISKVKNTAAGIRDWASTKLESGINKLKSIQETYFTGKPLGTATKIAGTVVFPGIAAVSAVAKGISGISKMTKKYGWFDPTGAYYVKNSDGTYNYYSANGDLIEENLDDPVIAANIASGIFVRGEIPNNHDAANDSKTITGKIKNFWANAKDKIGGALDKASNTVSGMWSRFKKWWGGDSSDTTEDSTGGYGDGRTSVDRSNGFGGFGSDRVNNFPYYSQNDPRIKNQPYNLSNGIPDTMGNRGCGPTAMAMVASKLTGKTVDPKSAANLAEQAGFSTNVGTDPGYFGYAAKRYGLKSAEMTTSADTIKQTIGKGIPAIIQGKNIGGSSPYTKNGHYVVATGMKGDQVLVNDPRGKSKSKAYSINDLVKGSGHMWAFGGMGGYGDGPATMNNFPYLSQSDSRWGKTPYTAIGDSSQTIGSSGCGTTSMAMILRSFGNNVSPVDTAKYSLDHGFRTANSGTSWGFFSNIGKAYGLTTTDLGKNAEAISNALASGKPVIGSMGPGYFTKGGHFITLVGANSSGNILVNDPAGTKGMERSSKPWPLSVFMDQGKNFWSFDKAGKGSIGNVVDAGTIQATQSISPTTVSTTGLTTTGEDTSDEGGNKMTFSSITDWLGGLANAFLSPIKKFFGFDTSSDDSTSSTSGMSDYAGTDTESSNVTTIDTKTGDYIGKYVARFESGNKGPSMISSGKGDNGGVSFGSYQFPSYKKEIASSDSMLSKFWNKYYASKYPGVNPGDNQAFKDAWRKEADADSDGFFKNEHEFIADLYYVPFRNKVKNIVDLDNYDRAAQEAAWSTAVQFGSGNTVFDKAFGGQNQSATAPTDFINRLQDYKRDSVNTRFKSSSASVRQSIANRHNRDERSILLGLAGKEPIGAHDVIDNSAATDNTSSKQLEYSNTTVVQPTQVASGGFGGFGTGKRLPSRIHQKTYKDVEYYVDRPGSPLGGFGMGESGDPTVISLLEQALVELRGTNRGIASLNDKEFTSSVSISAQDNSTHNSVTAGGNGAGSNQQRSKTGAPPVTFNGYEAAKKIAKGELLQQ